METKDFLILLSGSQYKAAPEQDTLVIVNRTPDALVRFACSSNVYRAKYTFDEGSGYIEQRIQSNQVEIDRVIPSAEFHFRYPFTFLTVSCFVHTVSVDLNGSGIGTLYVKCEDNSSPDVDLILGDAVSTLAHIDLQNGDTRIAYAAVSNVLRQLAAAVNVLKTSGTLNLIGHQLAETELAMVTELRTQRYWKILYDTDTYIQFHHTVADDVSFCRLELTYDNSSYHFGNSVSWSGNIITCRQSDPKWYHAANSIKNIAYYGRFTSITIPPEVYATLRGLTFSFSEYTNHTAMLNQFGKTALRNLAVLETFVYSAAGENEVDSNCEINLPDLTSRATIEGIYGYSLYINPRAGGYANIIQGAAVIRIGNDGTSSFTLNINHTFSAPVKIECENPQAWLVIGYTDDLTLPLNCASVSFLKDKCVGGILRNLWECFSTGTSRLFFNLSNQAIRTIVIPPDTIPAWPAKRYDLSGNCLTRETIDGLITYLSRQSWGNGYAFDLRNQTPYRAPGETAQALITDGQVKATVHYNTRSEFDLELTGAGIDTYNSCYKVAEYSSPGREYLYGRFFENGTEHYVYEVDIGRGIDAGTYRYVIKAWIITTRKTWQEEFGAAFLQPTVSTYKIIEVYEQWDGDTMIAEIAGPRRIAGNGMGAVPTLTLIE